MEQLYKDGGVFRVVKIGSVGERDMLPDGMPKEVLD